MAAISCKVDFGVRLGQIQPYTQMTMGAGVVMEATVKTSTKNISATTIFLKTTTGMEICGQDRAVRTELEG